MKVAHVGVFLFWWRRERRTGWSCWSWRTELSTASRFTSTSRSSRSASTSAPTCTRQTPEISLRGRRTPPAVALTRVQCLRRRSDFLGWPGGSSTSPALSSEARARSCCSSCWPIPRRPSGPRRTSAPWTCSRSDPAALGPRRGTWNLRFCSLALKKKKKNPS